ncbi:type VII secretion protein EccE [Amycolatopsis sp. NPDC059657]|uniref:type VII secretion protein EccE n=1 Tax=Amycolatopsis sp. NPDC059657 TaxID=3346899 RepID=UPI00367150E2
MSVDAPASGVLTPRAAGPKVSVATAPWILPVRAIQVAIWEIAALAVLLAYTVDGVSQPMRITVAAVAGLIFVTTSVRIAGKHVAGWTVTWLGHRLRRHDSRRDSPDPLHRIAGALKVRQHVDRAGNRFGVAEIDGGWSAIVRLKGPMTPDTATVVRILRDTYRRADIPLSTAQLLTWTVARGQTGKPYRVHWLTVRYRPDEAPVAALARGGGELGALRSTACAALGLMGALAEAGYESTVLEANELAEELRVALGAGRQAEPADAWRSWSAGQATQVCFAPVADHDAIDALDVFVPAAAFTASSYTLRRTPGGKEKADVVIRVGGELRASELGIRAVPLHGRHASGVRRSLPLALVS